MAPPQRHDSRPLMLAAAAPLHESRGLMSVDPAAFEGFDLHLELKRLLWSAAILLAALVYLGHLSAR